MKAFGTTAGSARRGVLYTGMRPKTFIGGGLSDLARALKCDDSLAVVVEYDNEQDD